MREHLKTKPLKYTTANRYHKKRIYKKKATQLVKAMVCYNYTLSSSVFHRRKQLQHIIINNKMLKTLVISEPVSFGLLSLTFQF